LIKGIIFDLGNTLIKLTDQWEHVNQAGAEAMATWYLKKKHIKLDSTALIETFLAERTAAMEAAQETESEIVAEQWLQAALLKIEAPASAGAFAEAALKTFFGPQEAACQVYPDAIDTLKTCRAHGYRVGLYSNAPDDALVQRIVNRSKLRPWLSPTFSSAGWGWRKPKADPFY
jgi:FMN phosphatase YigB (HAD superfamily)